MKDRENIIEHKRIDLYGKMLFEKAIVKPPFKKPNLMPDEACFLHIREGGYNSISQEELINVCKGQSVLMKCGNFLSQMLPDKKTGMYEAVAVHFHPDVMRKIYSKDIPSFLIDKKSEFKKNMAKVEASIPINKYVEDILFYFEHPQLVNDDILVLKTKEIILLLMQTNDACTVIEILKNLFTKKAIDFKTTIEAHIFSEITLIELAQLTNLSLSSFKRQFKKLYRTTPSKYISTRRLEKSKELLKISDQPISDIAYDCGFKTISHFSKNFRNEYGVSPSEYRLNVLEK